MKADLEGTAELAQRIADFGWTWSASDVERLVDLCGWTTRSADEQRATFTTRLAVNRPNAYVTLDPRLLERHGGVGEAIRELSIKLTDNGEGTPDRKIRRLTGELERCLSAVLGSPTCHEHGRRPEKRWILADVDVGLLVMRTSINLGVLNPRYTAFLRRAGDL